MNIIIEFENGGSPYTVTTNKGLFDIIKKYQIDVITIEHYTITGRNRKPAGMTTYNFIKETLRAFIIEWSLLFNEYTCFWSDVMEWGNFFEEYGNKYGLTKELKENGII